MYAALARSLAFCADKYAAKLAGYVFMPTHFHLVLFLDGNQLGAFMRNFKKFIAQKAAKDLGIRTEHLWMPRFDRLAIESEDILRSRLTYLHNNPVKASLASQPSGGPAPEIMKVSARESSLSGKGGRRRGVRSPARVTLCEISIIAGQVAVPALSTGRAEDLTQGEAAAARHPGLAQRFLRN